jgi:hypothetical protein
MTKAERRRLLSDSTQRQTLIGASVLDEALKDAKFETGGRDRGGLEQGELPMSGSVFSVGACWANIDIKVHANL